MLISAAAIYYILCVELTHSQRTPDTLKKEELTFKFTELANYGDDYLFLDREDSAIYGGLSNNM